MSEKIKTILKVNVTIHTEILGDRSDKCKYRFHLNALTFELQKHKVFDDEVEIENFLVFCVLLKHYEGEVEVEIKYRHEVE